MRLGRVEMCISYVVDLDDQNMVDHAKESLMEDVTEAVLRDGLDGWVKIVDARPGDTEADIEEFLTEEGW